MGVTLEDLEPLRRRAFAVAYRMLGSVGDAEDVAQEALLRLTRAPAPPDEPAAWVTTVATRLSIDHLRLARVRRETYAGPWLPEPLVESAEAGPHERAELVDTLSQAFLVLLERLTPLERAAFLLFEVFELEHREVAEALGRSEAASRQLVRRARARLGGGPPRFDADPQAGRALLERFLAASEEGDLASLQALLADDVVLVGDGGGKAPSISAPVTGAAAVAELLVRFASGRRAHGPFSVQLATVNGQPGRVLRDPAGRVWDVLALDVRDGRITAVRVVRNPDKLAALGAVTPPPAGPSEGP